MTTKHTDSHEARQNGMTIPENSRGNGSVRPEEANETRSAVDNETERRSEGWKVVGSSKGQRLETGGEHPMTVDDGIGTVEASTTDNKTIGDRSLNNEEVTAE